jgi:hypothetical protein
MLWGKWAIYAYHPYTLGLSMLEKEWKPRDLGARAGSAERLTRPSPFGNETGLKNDVAYFGRVL